MATARLVDSRQRHKVADVAAAAVVGIQPLMQLAVGDKSLLEVCAADSNNCFVAAAVERIDISMASVEHVERLTELDVFRDVDTMVDCTARRVMDKRFAVDSLDALDL